MVLVSLALAGVVVYSALTDTTIKQHEFDESFDPYDVQGVKTKCREMGFSEHSLNRILRKLLEIGTIKTEQIQEFEKAYRQEWHRLNQQDKQTTTNEYDKMVQIYQNFKGQPKIKMTYECRNDFNITNGLFHCENDYGYIKVAEDVYNNTIWNDIAMFEARILPRHTNTPYNKSIGFKQIWGVEIYEDFPYTIEEIYKLCVQQQGYEW